MKTIKRNKPYRRKGFPLGIFIMLFLVESLIAGAAISFYLRQSVLDTIREVEKYTVNYSLTLAEAFADTAARSYSSKKLSTLKNLFQEKISENIVDEALFVLNDGRLVVHSSAEREAQLKGNIGTDEMAYNIDLILQPAREQSQKAVIIDYNIIDKGHRFNREQRDLIKAHIYEKINITGWLISRAVFVKNKPVGTVNFIISRERISDIIASHIDALIKWLIVSLAVSWAVSFVVSIIVFIRQRSVENRALAHSASSLRIDSKRNEQRAVISLDDNEIIPLNYKESSDETDEQIPDMSARTAKLSDEPITIEILAEFDPEKNGSFEDNYDPEGEWIDLDDENPDFERALFSEEYSDTSGRQPSGAGRMVIRDAIPVTDQEA